MKFKREEMYVQRMQKLCRQNHWRWWCWFQLISGKCGIAHIKKWQTKRGNITWHSRKPLGQVSYHAFKVQSTCFQHNEPIAALPVFETKHESNWMLGAHWLCRKLCWKTRQRNTVDTLWCISDLSHQSVRHRPLVRQAPYRGLSRPGHCL